MFYTHFFDTIEETMNKIDYSDLDDLVDQVIDIRDSKGRIFFLGNGGSVATSSHIVNDFRKIANIECYNIADNISELSARTNDDGFDTIFIEWLKISRLSSNDAIFVISVGGGDKENNVSTNIVNAIDYAREKGASVLGIVGRNGGYTEKYGDAVVIIPPIDPELITPITESFHSIIAHLLVSHPYLKSNQTKWESLDG